MPQALIEIVEDFQSVTESERLEMLLDFSDELPELPTRFAEHPDLLEQVVECQTPLFLAIEVEPAGEHKVSLFFSAPPEAPTTRGFASVLHEGLDGLPAAQVLAVPDDMPNQLGLTRALTPLRLRGMSAMLGRIKRQVSERLAAAEG